MDQSEKPVEAVANAGSAAGRGKKRRGPRLKQPKHVRALLARQLRQIVADPSIPTERRARLLFLGARELSRAIEMETHQRLDELERQVERLLGSGRKG